MKSWILQKNREGNDLGGFRRIEGWRRFRNWVRILKKLREIVDFTKQIVKVTIWVALEWLKVDENLQFGFMILWEWILREIISRRVKFRDIFRKNYKNKDLARHSVEIS